MSASDKVQLLIMCSNGADTIERVLWSFKDEVDRFFIVLNNCSDHTEKLVKKFKKESGLNVVLKHTEWEGFSKTRNKCLDLCYNLNYKWTYFVDDSYEYIGPKNALKNELYTMTANVNIIDVSIQRVYNEEGYKRNIKHYSKRIVRTAARCYFTGDIHEVIYGITDYTLKNSELNDIPTQMQLERTKKRIDYDLSKLVGKKDPRSLYYIATLITKKFFNKEATFDEVLKAYNDRFECSDGGLEETFLTHIYLGHLYGSFKTQKDDNEAIKHYLLASAIFEGRAGECYYYCFIISGKYYFLQKAYMHKIHGACKLCVDENIYSNLEPGIIEITYNEYNNY